MLPAGESQYRRRPLPTQPPSSALPCYQPCLPPRSPAHALITYKFQNPWNVNDIFNKLTEKCVPHHNFLTRTKHYVGRTRSFLDYYLLTPARPTYTCQMFLATCPQQVSVTPHTTDQLRIQERQFPARRLHRTAFTTQFKLMLCEWSSKISSLMVPLTFSGKSKLPKLF